MWVQSLDTTDQRSPHAAYQLPQSSTFALYIIFQSPTLRMACLLQPECNLPHGHFRCWLPVEVVDVEVKITSMQGMHIFRRDRTTQLIKCMPWNTKLCPHPTIIKKMKTFLEVEGKMGHIPQPTSSQYRPPHSDTNPKVRKDNAAEKQKGRGQHQQKVSGLAQPLSLMRQPHNCL